MKVTSLKTLQLAEFPHLLWLEVGTDVSGAILE
jgi:hypothetical protein